MDAAADLPAWLRALEPLSVPFVILLMAAGWLLERRRDGERRSRYDARMRATAYELYIILGDWRTAWPMWGHPELYAEDYDGPREEAPEPEELLDFVRELEADCEEARELARSLVADAPAASNPLSRMAREVYRRVAALTVTIRHMGEAPSPAGGKRQKWAEDYRRLLGRYREEHLDESLELLEAELEDLLMF